jgi:hypothetical protein
MTGTEKIYFSPGANPPFPGYEDWLEEVKRAPIWQATGPRRYGPDMRDGLGKELFPPPPPRSDLEPEPSKNYDRETAIAAMDFIWDTRHDLVWETMWWLQYLDDDPDEGDRVTKDLKYDIMFRWAIRYELGKIFAHFDNSAMIEMLIEIQRQLRSFSQHLPLSIRRAPWVRADGLMPNLFDFFKIRTSMNKRRSVLKLLWRRWRE